MAEPLRTKQDVLATVARLRDDFAACADAECPTCPERVADLDAIAAAVRAACWVEGGHHWPRYRLPAGDRCRTCGQPRTQQNW